jgi:hypothetical protein
MARFLALALISITFWLMAALALPIEETSDLVRRETWGSGKYTIDLDVYHRTVKPQFISAFNQQFGSKFSKMCGSNPDFAIEKDGTVYPNAVKKGSQCSKKTFNLNLGDHVLAAKGNSKRFDEEDEPIFIRGQTWGSGKYTIDLDVYHRTVKPQFISAFNSNFGSKFSKMCGSNPDFAIEKDGTVYPNAVKKGGQCSKKTFNLNLGDIVLAAKK